MNMKLKSLLFIIISLAIGLLVMGCSNTAFSDCNEDMECFQEALTSCSSSKVVKKLDTDIFGVTQKTEMLYEVGKQDEKCALSFTIKEIEIEYSDEFVDQLVALGQTKEEVLIGLEESKKILSELTNKKATCTSSNIEKIAPLFNLIDTGSVEGVNMDEFECSGEYFDTIQKTFTEEKLNSTQ